MIGISAKGKVTSAKAATAAAKTLDKTGTQKDASSAAGSALAQKPGGEKPTKAK